MYNLDSDKQLEVLRWLMYAWDGQWLGRTTALHGATEANKLNSRVRTAFGKLEMKALLALLNKKQADNLADAAEILKTYFKLVFGERGFQGRFQEVESAATGGSRLRIEITKLTALDTLKKVAQVAGENPSLVCELLWNAWLETLLPDAQLQVSMRSSGTTDIYQIDSLTEAFTSPLPVPTHAPAPELSPIAAALQIPISEVATADPYGSGAYNSKVALPSQPASMPPAPPFQSASAMPPAPPFQSASAMPPAPPFQSASVMPSVPPFQAPSQAASPFAGSARPLIGGSEPGAAQNFNAGLGGLAGANSPTLENPLRVDPNGRALFSSDPEADARQKIASEKARSGQGGGLARMFTGSSNKAPEQPIPMPTSLASKIDFILQRKFLEARAVQPHLYTEPIRVMGGPEGDLQIIIGQRIYQSVGDVPPGPVKEILQQAVEEWSDTQNS